MVVVPYGLVDKLVPGNRCRVTGQMRVKVEKNNIASMFLECYNITKAEEDYSDIVVTDEDIVAIKELADEADVYKDLSNSINPDIWGYDIIKLALVLQMFGGVSVKCDGEGKTQRRLSYSPMRRPINGKVTAHPVSLQHRS